MLSTPRRILVTGGAGFIGSAFVEMVAELGTDVRVIDLFTYAGRASNLAGLDPATVEVLVGDVRDLSAVLSAAQGCDAIVHFAAESHVDRSVIDPLMSVDTNVFGTANVVEVARRLGVRAVVVSTDEVYGSLTPDAPASTESDPLLATSPYAGSKAAADLLTLSWHRSFGTDVVITRGANTYGPRQHEEKVIPCFATRLLDGADIQVHGDGEQLREWLHVTDHCRAVWTVLCSGTPGGVYNIPGERSCTVNEIAERLLALHGGNGRITHVADRAVNDRRYELDGSALHRLGWRHTIGLDEGLSDTYAWFRANA
jgi:dTDP-glucose 4,6-dehydratase